MKRASILFSNYRSRGFTLVEMLLSAAIMAILLLGMQSAMLLASRAAPDRAASVNKNALTAARALDRFSSDLTYASTIVSITAKSVQFTVPDRTGDNSPETITYSWSGVAGDPLLRTINNGAAVTIASNVYEFSLTCDKRSQQQSSTATESGEVLLSSNDGISLLDLGDGDTNANNWYGQYFQPSIPAGASSWRVTRVRIPARVHGAALGSTRVQLRKVNGATSPGTVIEEHSMLESSLTSSYSWQEIDYTNASGLTPGSGLFLVLEWASDADSCDVQYQALLGLGGNTYMIKTTNGGSSWTAPLTQDLIYYVYGTYSTTNPVTYNYWLTDVRVALRCGTDSRSRVCTTIRTIDEPQVSGP